MAEIFEMKDSCLPVVENRGTSHSQDPQTYLISLSMVYFMYTTHFKVKTLIGNLGQPS